VAQNQNFNSAINLALPVSPPDSLKSPEVLSVYRALITSSNNLLAAIEQFVGVTQKTIDLWSQLLPQDTILRHLAGRFYVKFSEAMVFGDFVNIHNVAGVANARKANAASGLVKPARGYCNVIDGVAAGSFGEVILSQGFFVISGLVSGQAIYLSVTTPGLATTVPPSAAGELEQFLGFGIASNLAYIDISQGTYIQH